MVFRKLYRKRGRPGMRKKPRYGKGMSSRPGYRRLRRVPRAPMPSYNRLAGALLEKGHFGPTSYTDPVSLTSTFSVGLTNGTGEGMQLINVTPQIIKGDDRNNRQGNSVKIVGGCVHINLAGQSAQSMNSKLIFELWKVSDYGLYGSNPTPATLGSDLFKQDPITSRYSSNCGRNPNFFTKFRCVRRKIVYTPQDNGAASNFVKQFTMPFKEGQVIRWDDSAGGLNYLNTEYHLVVRCSNGNASGTVTSATSNAALGLNTAVNTGFQFQLYTDFYFYDT